MKYFWGIYFHLFTSQFLGIFKIWDETGTPISIYNTEPTKTRNQMAMVQPWIKDQFA